MRLVPDLLQVVLGLAIIAGLTAFKLTAGHSVTLIDFLFIPVVGVGWFARARWCGYFTATVAATSSAAVAMLAETQASFGAAALSAIARLTLYLVVLQLLGMMRQERAAHQHAAATDSLTGVSNASAFAALAGAEIERSQRYVHELSLAFLDVDDFKQINDRLGHIEGDHVLRQISHMLLAVVRSVDSVGRVGGDEFTVLMPETNAASAKVVVERLRAQLGRVKTADGMPISCSIGLVTFARPPASIKELMAAGDELMYRAKQGGKDCIEQAERSGTYAVNVA
jgi:diguanylate cyclase (GGDEF)-like protein